jgi:hypothetical protein
MNYAHRRKRRDANSIEYIFNRIIRAHSPILRKRQPVRNRRLLRNPVDKTRKESLQDIYN